MLQRENEENVTTLELSVQEFCTEDLSSVAKFVFDDNLLCMFSYLLGEIDPQRKG